MHTGINNILILAIVFILFFSSCLKKKYDFDYEPLVENKTSDTLEVIVRARTTYYIVNPFCKFTIHPFDTIHALESGLSEIVVNEGTDPVVHFFEQRGSIPIDTVLIYRHDTLKTIWAYPNFRGPCSEHSFFNYNSWKSWLIDGSNGRILFTIYPSDLTLNKK